MMRPSPAIFVRADTSVGECIRFMKDHSVGAVLVVGDDADASLVGIFSERDLLKNIDVIKKGDHWARPVRTVMTSPVFCLDISEAKNAAKMMVEKSIRHIPITGKDTNGNTKIIGVYSMRDMFRYMVTEEGGEDLDAASTQRGIPKLRPAIISADEAFVNLMSSLVSAAFVGKFARVLSGMPIPKEIDVLFLDIDRLPREQWTGRIKQANKECQAKLIVLAFNQSIHDLETMSAMGRLAKSKKFWIFKKPAELSQLVHQLQALFS